MIINLALSESVKVNFVGVSYSNSHFKVFLTNYDVIFILFDL